MKNRLIFEIEEITVWNGELGQKNQNTVFFVLIWFVFFLVEFTLIAGITFCYSFIKNVSQT